jgi:hypothetical protein
MNVLPSREPIVMTFERPLAAFARPNCIFVDKDAQEIHSMSSSHMDARPFKDPNFELQRVLLDKDVQAVAVVHEEGIQVCFCCCGLITYLSRSGVLCTKIVHAQAFLIRNILNIVNLTC